MKSPISSSSSSSSFINSRRNRLSPFLLFTLLGFIAFVVVTIYGRLFFFKYQFHQITTTSTTTTAPSLHSLNKPVLSQPDPPHIFPPPPPPPPPILTLETPEKKEEYIERVRAPKLGHGPTTTTTRIGHDDDPEEEVVVVGKKGLSEAEEQCDLFNGRWVMDESNRPLYEEWECPYIQPQLTCQEHGRPDKEYQKWRWQPHGCDLPSFNATFMLEKLRGKRMMFVGDSLNRGQYVSMVCLLHRLIPEHAKSMKTFESLTVFRAQEYNATIEFYWAPFLLESNSDNAVIHRVTDRIVRKGSINKHGRHWEGVDVLVFNTYLWWITGSKMKILRGSFNDERKDIIQMETEDAYRMAMKSMLKWVEKNVDQKKTRVFFTSMSPSHAKSVDWGGDRNGNCYNETTPIEDPSYWGVGSRKSIMRVIGDVFSKSKVPITFLNITQLSEYRKDAHTSIYKKQWNPLTPEQLANPASYADCTHWCLPGLQDTWNELLYAKLFYP